MIPFRGEIWWVDFDLTRGYKIRKTRPCIVVTDDRVNRFRNTHVVIPVSTTAPKEWPLYIPVPSVSRNSQAVIDQVRATDRSRFRSRKGFATPDELGQIDEALRIVLALD